LAYSQHYTATQRGRTYTHIPIVAADNNQTLNESTRRQIMGLSRFLYNNSSLCRSVIDTISIYSVGSGLKPQSLAASKAASLYEDYFNNWGQICDAQGKLNLNEIQFLCSIAIDRCGDVGIALSKENDFPRINLVGSHRICSEYDNPAYEDGVAVDKFGRVKSYLVKAEGRYRKFAATDFILLQEHRREDQLRGVSSLTPVINTLSTIDDLLRWESTACLVQSSIGMIITSPEGEANSGSSFIEEGYTAADTGSLALDSFSEGQIPRLAAGEDIKPFSGGGGRPSATFNGFIEHLIHSLSLAFCIPFEFLYSPKGLNGASQRFVLKKAERTFNKRKKLIADKLMRRLFVWIIAHGIKAGKLPKDDNWYKVEFIGDAYPSIDYGRDSAQTRENLKLGITTLQDASLEAGKSWESIRRQSFTESDNLLSLAAELAEKHGISLDSALNLLSTRSMSGLPTLETEEE